MKKTLVLVASALLAAPLAAFAIGPVAGDKSFTVSGSGSSDNNFDESAYGVSGELGYFLTDKWQAGIRQSINGTDTDGNGINGNKSGNRWAGSTRGFIDYNFLDGTYRPYIGANLGAIYGEEVSNTGSAGLEAGLKLYVLEKTYVNFGIEYSWLFNDTNDFENKSNDGLYNYTIGVGFNW